MFFFSLKAKGGLGIEGKAWLPQVRLKCAHALIARIVERICKFIQVYITLKPEVLN